MTDLFDFGGNPIEPRPAPPPAPQKTPEPPKAPPELKTAPAPAQASPAPIPAPIINPGLVASFVCGRCQCMDEIKEPAPQTVPCWGCDHQMRRWWPKEEPPLVSAREWNGKAAGAK